MVVVVVGGGGGSSSRSNTSHITNTYDLIIFMFSSSGASYISSSSSSSRRTRFRPNALHTVGCDSQAGYLERVRSNCLIRVRVGRARMPAETLDSHAVP